MFKDIFWNCYMLLTVAHFWKLKKSSKRRQSLPVNVLPETFVVKGYEPPVPPIHEDRKVFNDLIFLFFVSQILLR